MNGAAYLSRGPGGGWEVKVMAANGRGFINQFGADYRRARMFYNEIARQGGGAPLDSPGGHNSPASHPHHSPIPAHAAQHTPAPQRVAAAAPAPHNVPPAAHSQPPPAQHPAHQLSHVVAPKQHATQHELGTLAGQLSAKEKK